MDKETYEALKQLLAVWRNYMHTDVAIKTDKQYKQVENWIDEVAKEYCPDCGERNHKCKPE